MKNQKLNNMIPNNLGILKYEPPIRFFNEKFS